MSVYVRFHCDGCDAVAEGTNTVSPSPYKVGGPTTIESVAPEGWVACDPYIYCTYCPTCWASIVGPADATTEEVHS